MATFMLHGRSLVAGLHWGFHDSRAAHRAEARRLEPSAMVLRQTDEGLLAGWQREPTSRRDPGYAAALLIGAAHAEAIIFNALGGELTWICAIRDGLPLPGTDQVVPNEQADQQLAEFAGYQMHGVIIGSHPAALLTLEAALAVLSAAQWSDARLRSARLSLRPALLAGAVAASVGFALWVGLRPLPQPPVTSPVVTAALIGAPPAVPQTMLQTGPDAASLAKAREEAFQRWQGEVPEVQALGAQWLDVLRSLPLSHQGYRPVRMQCRVEACTVDWVWRGGRFSAEVLDGLPGTRVGPVSLAGVRDRVQTRFDLQPTLREIPLALIDDAEHFGFDLLERLTLPGLQLSIVEQRQPVHVRYVVGGQTYEDLIGRAQTVQISVGSLIAAQTALQRLAQDSIYPERASFTFNRGTISAQLEARYVVADS